MKLFRESTARLQNWLIYKTLLFCTLLILSFPSIAVSQIAETVINENQGNFDTIEPLKELPYYIRSNCYNYIKYRTGYNEGTAKIHANLTTEGEIGVLYYPKSNLWHYVVIESMSSPTVTFSETNFKGQTKSTRSLPKSAFIGFFKL